MIFVFSFLVGVFCFAAKAFFVSKKKTVIEKQEPNETAVISQIEQKKRRLFKIVERNSTIYFFELTKFQFFTLCDLRCTIPEIIFISGVKNDS